MSAYKAGDSKREEFRRYLERAGVIDALTKVLVNLYEEPEKPNNALDFLFTNLGSDGPASADVEGLKTDIVDLRAKLALLAEENEDLRGRLAKYEPSSAPEEAA